MRKLSLWEFFFFFFFPYKKHHTFACCTMRPCWILRDRGAELKALRPDVFF